MSRPLSIVLEDLGKATAESKKAEEALEAAKEKLQPLEIAAKGSRNAVENLMQEYQRLTGIAASPVVRRGRPRTKTARRTGGKKRAYNATPESKVAATEKRMYTRAINAGMSKAAATKAGKEAAAKLAKKLGVK